MSLARFGSVWVGLARLARFGSFLLLALTGFDRIRRSLSQKLQKIQINEN